MRAEMEAIAAGSRTKQHDIWDYERGQRPGQICGCTALSGPKAHTAGG